MGYDDDGWRFSGVRLHRARTAAGLSRTDLAYLVRRVAPTIGRYERDESAPPPHIAARMAVVLEIDADELYEAEAVQADA